MLVGCRRKVLAGGTRIIRPVRKMIASLQYSLKQVGTRGQLKQIVYLQYTFLSMLQDNQFVMIGQAFLRWEYLVFVIIIVIPPLRIWGKNEGKYTYRKRGGGGGIKQGTVTFKMSFYTLAKIRLQISNSFP